ncbi:4'-phosphopantetheinyl transferase superfamily protein [Morganella psychrotolerans]|uniref:4'-phosphopantetheinyl transferase superfamily protein n=1 Tax=Morganella psychrotolerans TaxID=368603 RepID=UPI0039AFA619
MSGTGRVTVWLADIPALCSDDKACAAVLSACAGVARNTSSFIAGRRLLAHAAGYDALRTIHLSAQGKPCFADPALPRFSISHSRDYIALALTVGADVGLDIEVIRPRHRYLSLAARYFSVAEQSALHSAPDEKTALSFFWHYWTAHEAVIKQRGETVWQIRPDDTCNSVLDVQQLQLPALHTPECAVSLCYSVGLQCSPLQWICLPPE